MSATYIIAAIDEAVAKPDTYPDPVVLPILQNDLRKTIEVAQEYRCTLDDVDAALRHVRSRVPVQSIQRVVRKWGKK